MKYCFYLLLSIFFPINICAQVELPDLFSDHMVLQREMPIPIWGNAESDVVLKISLGQNTVTTKADYFGKWKTKLLPMKAGGPYELIIQSPSKTIQLKDIYIGEVWLCAGQSNMEWPLKKSATAATEIPLADSKRVIRLFHLKKKHDTYKTPYSPEELIEFSKGNYFHPTKWELSNSKTAAEFSGVAYFFGKELYDSLNVPIGLIQAAVGGSPAQSWISEEALASHPQLRELVLPAENKTWLDAEIIHPWLASRAKENWANWKKSNKTDERPGHPFAPHYLYDAAIKSLAPYAMRGAIWYQGESNATHPSSYFAMKKMLLKSWRSQWKQGSFPFYFVQLPQVGNRSLWAEFRAAQQECLSIPNTGMVVAIDEGHPTDVHPREKKVIGKRLAHLALSKTYDKKNQGESPMLVSYDWKKEEHKIVFTFEKEYNGLKTKEGELPQGFSMQGYTKQGTLESIFFPKNITIEKNKITLIYPKDFLLTTIKYAWAPAPENNIVNSSELPLAPFKINLEGNN